MGNPKGRSEKKRENGGESVRIRANRQGHQHKARHELLVKFMKKVSENNAEIQ